MTAKSMTTKNFYHTYLEPEDAFEWIILVCMVGAFLSGVTILVYTFTF